MMIRMSTAVDRAYRDLSPLDVRIQTHRRYSEFEHDVEADVLRAAAVTAADRLLDVGPGTGTFLARLSAAGHTAPLAALDFSAESAATCAAHPRRATPPAATPGPCRSPTPPSTSSRPATCSTTSTSRPPVSHHRPLRRRYASQVHWPPSPRPAASCARAAASPPSSTAKRPTRT